MNIIWNNVTDYTEVYKRKHSHLLRPHMQTDGALKSNDN